MCKINYIDILNTYRTSMWYNCMSNNYALVCVLYMQLDCAFLWISAKICKLQRNCYACVKSIRYFEYVCRKKYQYNNIVWVIIKLVCNWIVQFRKILWRIVGFKEIVMYAWNKVDVFRYV